MIAPVHQLDIDASPYGVLLHSNEEGGRTLFALGCEQLLSRMAGEDAFGAFRSLVDQGDWVFTVLGYDLKNELEQVHSHHRDELGFPDLCAFIPEHVWEWDGEQWLSLKGVGQPPIRREERFHLPAWQLRPRISRETYLKDVSTILEHIQRGDIYELNYCQEFHATNVTIDAGSLYNRLNERTRAPFSALFNTPEAILVSGSPERFLKKEGGTVTSQPIKGTTSRGVTPEDDIRRIQALRSDPKEIAENVMITDLVRNDLSRVALRGSVKVEELCGIYSFRTVHQMISTVSCQVSEQAHPVDIIQACFPMGSMTGAPKVKAMELIESLEHSKRGWYSGAVGYISPSGDFDFNVIIRSLLHNPKSGVLSASVGGAITAKATPEAEYEECMLKLEALRMALAHAE